MTISTIKLAKSYGDEIALTGLDMNVEAGSFTVIIGPPKCGKSVLFRMMVGLEKADSGQIIHDDVDITNQLAGQRRIGYVPQSFALYPHLSVRANIAYPMTLAGAPKDEIARQVDRAAGMLSITHLLTKTPDQLSGGEKQRTALARGLLKNAKVFALDDPLVGLDYKLRERLMDDLKDLRRELNATFLYATSDSIEALRLASDLIVMDAGGEVLQACEPAEAYTHPASARVMELLGFPRANLLAGSVENGTVRAGPLALQMDAGNESEVTVGVRPEAVRLVARGDAATTATVRLVENLGSEMIVYVDAQGTALTCAFAVGQSQLPDIGDEVGLSVDKDEVRLFAASGSALAH